MSLRFVQSASQAHDCPLTIRRLLVNAPLISGDQTISYRDQLTYSYRDFVGRVGRMANMLTALGADQGMTIAIMDWDSHRYLEGYFAIPMMGAVLQTVNVRLPAPQVLYTLQHAKAEILLVHHDFFPLIDALLPQLPEVKAIVAIMDDNEGALPTWARDEYEALMDVASPDYPFEDFDENAVATTFYTTGTTGLPKGVCFTHRQLVLHTLAGAGSLCSASAINPLIGSDVYMPLTPMFHVHAWGIPYVATMMGLKQVYPGRYEPEMLCRLQQEHRITFSHCVPTILQMILQAAEKTGTDLTGWKMMIGGSALSKTLCTQARAKGMQVAVGYGMSETAPTICMSRLPNPNADEGTLLNDLTAAGYPIPLVEARIVDDAMNGLPHDGSTRGELVVRAPWLTPCYTGMPQESDALWHGGWLHTQDIATIGPDGQICIRDRLKDVIKTGGEWIDSIHLEELISSAEGVAEVSVIAIPDDQWGERPLAVVVPAPNATLSLATLNKPVEAAIKEGAITRYARLDRFEAVEHLPRTGVGKIDKKALRSQYGMAGAAPVNS